MPAIKITTPNECNFYVLDHKGYSKREYVKKWDVARIEDKDGRPFAPQQLVDISVWVVTEVEMGEQGLISIEVRPFTKTDVLKAAGAWAEEETDKMSIKEIFVKKGGMKEEEYDEWAEKAKAGWGKFIKALERREMSYSGAASTITHEMKNLRYLKGIDEKLDAMMVIMKVAFETYDDNAKKDFQARLQKGTP